MRTLFFLLAAVVVSFAQSNTAPAQAKTNPTSLPFTSFAGGLLLVPATLNGSIAAHVVLDTGAGLDVLSPALVAKLHGKAAGQFTAFRMTGERLNIPLFVIPKVAVGPMVKHDDVVGSWDALDKFHLDGIIAARDFRGQPFTINFPAHTVVFESGNSLAERRAAGTAIPLQLDQERGIALDLFARFLIAGQPAQCEIDSGSQGATISTRYMKPLGIAPNAPGVQKREMRTIAGAVETRYDASVTRISLQAAPRIGVNQPRVAFADIIYDCVIGTEFWKGRALTLDLADRRMVVSPAVSAESSK